MRVFVLIIYLLFNTYLFGQKNQLNFSFPLNETKLNFAEIENKTIEIPFYFSLINDSLKYDVNMSFELIGSYKDKFKITNYYISNKKEDLTNSEIYLSKLIITYSDIEVDFIDFKIKMTR